MIGCVILMALSIVPFVISYLQFQEKGYLFNNAYLWASPAERRWMDEHKESKKPYYRQSGFAFLLVGALLLIFAAYIATDWIWLLAVLILAVILSVVYAVVSSVRIERQERQKQRK